MTGNSAKIDGQFGLLNKELLELVYSENSTELKWRDVVKRTMGILIAARKNGKSFDELSKIYAKYGFSMTPLTLRAYFFEFKMEAAANREINAQLKQIQTQKNEFVFERAVINGANANQAVVKAVKTEHRRLRIVSTSKDLFGNAPGDGQEHADHAAPAASQQRRQPRPQAEKRTEPRKTSQKSQQTPDQDIPSPSPAGSAGAPKIEDLRRYASTANPTEELTDDVILKADNRVYYASGEPFDGVLSERQIRLLEISKKLIAKKKGNGGNRTGSSFTTIPKDL
jgi:hypothetical protein